jgi:hypothetical protein
MLHAITTVDDMDSNSPKVKQLPMRETHGEVTLLYTNSEDVTPLVEAIKRRDGFECIKGIGGPNDIAAQVRAPEGQKFDGILMIAVKHARAPYGGCYVSILDDQRSLKGRPTSGFTDNDLKLVVARLKELGLTVPDADELREQLTKTLKAGEPDPNAPYRKTYTQPAPIYAL